MQSVWISAIGLCLASVFGSIIGLLGRVDILGDEILVNVWFSYLCIDFHWYGKKNAFFVGLHMWLRMVWEDVLKGINAILVDDVLMVVLGEINHKW